VRCHRGNPTGSRKNIAHAGLIAGRFSRFLLSDDPLLREGRRLLEQYACRRCHAIGGKGNRLSVSLDHSARRRTPDELATAIRMPTDSMPDFRTTEEQRRALVTALLAESEKADRSDSGPRVVHFSDGVVGKDIFSVKCGGCHRVLTSRLGGLGRGAVGPNLSGLLSVFYPATFRNGQPWNEERLREWLKNPRQSRPNAVMQPVTLTEKEFRDLVKIVR
jgi:mono/diheme cytochrome c family protein